MACMGLFKYMFTPENAMHGSQTTIGKQRPVMLVTQESFPLVNLSREWLQSQISNRQALLTRNKQIKRVLYFLDFIKASEF